MAALSSFLRFVLPSAPTALELAVERYLVDSAIELCRDTGIWRATLALADVTANNPVVTLTAPADSQITKITDLYFDGQHIEPIPPDSLPKQGDHWFDKTSSLPRGYFSTLSGVVTLVPAPEEDRTDVVRASVELAPSRDAATLPDFLLERFPEVVAMGALKRLAMEPGQAYSDPRKAELYEAMFKTNLRDIRREAQKGQTRSRFRVKARYF